MASHVVVIDSTARRATVKTTPNKHLSDVLEEACSKLGVNASQYGLKNNNKQVDLSRTFRLSGPSSGAKLELVQPSKSAGVVSVALQVPESEAQGAPNARLTDKFPSTTTLWLVLRKFEAGVAGGGGGGINRNFTARGAPAFSAGKSGTGRLYYEQPVLQVMNRELSSLTDLQKTLAQLGLNSGSALMRLSFRKTDTPLEEAMLEIQKYFDSVDGSGTAQITPTQPVAEGNATTSNQSNEIKNLPPVEQPTVDASPSNPMVSDVTADQTQSAESSQTASEPIRTLSGRPLSVYRPPSSSTPSAALTQYNDADYTPTVEHAQVHQKMLAQSGRNVRLLTDAQLAAQAEAEAEKLAAIKEIEIRVRFPDQSAVSSKFGQEDSASDLYNFTRDCLNEVFRNEPFLLRNPGMRGKDEIIADNGRKLIKDLLYRGRILVVFGWDDAHASMEARSAKNVLKTELRAKAVDLRVEDVSSAIGGDDKDEPGKVVNIAKQDGKEDDGEGKKRMPKWLKGLAKK